MIANLANPTLTIEHLFEILAIGSQPEIKEAKKQIEKLWRQDRRGNKFAQASWFILKLIDDFDRVSDPIHQAAIISGLSLFYLALADEHFVPLKDFIVKNLQNPDGRVREAARKTGDWLYISLSSRSDSFSYPKNKSFSQKRKAEQLVARQQSVDLIAELESLIDQYDDDSDITEYVEQMKPSINKSLQLFRSRINNLAAKPSGYDQLDRFLCFIPVAEPTGFSQRDLINHSSLEMENLELRADGSPIGRRAEIEQDIQQLLRQTKSDFSLQDVYDAVFNEEDSDDLMKIVAMFDRGGDASELDNILDLVTDAWNYFPHKSLGGLSPMER